MAEMYEFPCGCKWPIVGPPPREGALPLLDIDENNLPFCKAAFEIAAKGTTKGVFQLESSLGRHWSKKLKPESEEHLAALGALLRPGCLKTKDADGKSMTDRYCMRKNGEDEVSVYHPALEPILADTYQTICYQEQLMRIGKDLAGFDLIAVDKLRKAVGKKDQQELAKVRDMFLEGCTKKAIVTDEQANTIWGWMEKSGRYLFNKCIPGDETIRRAGTGRNLRTGKQSVEHMYRIRNDSAYAKAMGSHSLHRKWKRLGHYGKGLSLCDDGRVRANIIRDIQPAGRQTVYKLTLEDGRVIRATGNHKFPVRRGEITVAQMRVFLSRFGEQRRLPVFVCGKYEPTNFRIANRFSPMGKEEIKVAATGKAVNGCHGEANIGYTNGSFTEFMKNDTIIPRECGVCLKRKGRLELHHKNGDRTNSSIENLERLCSSCHKKRDYALGRTRRGEKGYPTHEVAVVSVEPDGECETYDVTMDAPNHTFVLGNSDVVTCNSHAMSYALLGYDTAYAKSHIPVAFFANWLYYAEYKADPREENAELVQDAKMFGVDIGPPDMRDLEGSHVKQVDVVVGKWYDRNGRFITEGALREPPEGDGVAFEPTGTEAHDEIFSICTDGVAVRFGLKNVKGVGNSQVVKLFRRYLEVRKTLNKPVQDWLWEEFLFHCGDAASSSSMRAWIGVGAFRWTGKSRTRLDKEYQAWETLTEKEKEWVRTNATPSLGLVSALRALGKTKKDGGGCANPKRADIVSSQANILESQASTDHDHPNTVAGLEETYLGVAITMTRVEGCDLSMVNCNCKEFAAGRTGRIVLGVEIKDARKVKTKSGKNPGQTMAFLTVEDDSGGLADVCVFPEAWSTYGYMLRKGNTVLLDGQKDPKRGGFIVDHVYQL